MLKMSRAYMNCNCDKDNHNILLERQGKIRKDKVILKECILIPVGYIVIVQHEDDGPWQHSRTQSCEPQQLFIQCTVH